jgi:serine-type D-Ala-D-Ala endopeptidase (penicillin-binding protein 7)
MKKRLLSALALAVIAVVFLPGTLEAPTVFAVADASPAPQKKEVFLASLRLAQTTVAPRKIVGADGRESLGVKTTADRVYVVDDRSGAELYAVNADKPTPLASITKLMTARVVRAHGLDWNRVITMENVVPDGGTPYFENGDKVTVRDLWKAMLVGSSNTAALALANATGLSLDEFVAEMNASAAGLGMVATSFSEPTGLSQDNISTPSDVAKLARTEFSDPEVVKTVALPAFDLVKISGKTKRVFSTDKLLGTFVSKAPYKLIGGKTGYIVESGYNMVVSLTKSGAAPITVVVMGSASNDLRFQEAKSIAYWTFQNYHWASPLAAATK